jgi:glycosyltransferase involved in cell wall biosynthesis
MKILFVSPFLPYPPVAGGHRQIWAWLTRLAQDHEVAFVGFYERESDAAGADEIDRLCAEARVRLRRPTPHAYPSFAQIPRWAAEFYSEELAGDVAAVTRGFQPHVVQILHTNMGQYRRHVGDAAVVVTALDIASIAHRRRIAATRGIERLEARFEWLRMLRYEAAVFRDAEHIVAVSQHDADFIKSVAGHTRVTAVPPGVDREQLAARGRRPVSGSVLYLGHMEHYPNLDGLLFLYHEIWPQVRRSIRDARLTVVGTGARQELARVAPDTLARIDRDPSLDLAGFVPDLGDVMDTTAVMAAPLRLGSGVRNKVIEAMAAGLPVVTTRRGAEGLAVRPGRELLIADGRDEFADRLVGLLRDGGLQGRLSEAGRKLVERDHNNDLIAKRLERALLRAGEARA